MEPDGVVVSLIGLAVVNFIALLGHVFALIVSLKKIKIERERLQAQQKLERDSNQKELLAHEDELEEISRKQFLTEFKAMGEWNRELRKALTELRDRFDKLIVHVEALEIELKKHGIEVPMRPK